MDLNNDGNPDILSGSYSWQKSPMAGIFQVLWGKKGGGFEPATPLNGTDGKPLIVKPKKDRGDADLARICTRPTAMDWDGDGDLDLVVGNFGGTFYLFTGEGKGKFAPNATPITTGGKPLKVPHHSDPFPVDWDGDGDLDLLSGAADGGVHWAENTAGKGKVPTLKPFKALIAPGKNVFDFERMKIVKEEHLDGPSGDTRVWVDDVNGDGKLDILVGDSTRLVSPGEGLTEEEFPKVYGEWQAEYQKLIDQFNDRNLNKKEKRALNKKMNEHYRRQEKIVTMESTGFVWLYLQK